MATPLVTYLRLQRALDRDVLASLRASAASVDSELRRLQGRVGIGNEMRATQLAASQAAINREMAAHWTRVGNLTAAHQATAAADAAEEAFRASAALSSVFDADDLDYLTRSVRASAQQGLSAAMERVSGSSYVPLAESVYDNTALTSGKIDEIVNSALARGASAAELARDVKAFVNPNTPGGIRYASMRLGRTELNNAFHASQVRQAQENPWTIGVLWHLSGSHPVPDECNQYAEETHIKDGDPGVFPPSDVPAKPHPQCLCYTTTVDVDRDEFIRQFEAGQYDEYLARNFPDLPLEEVKVNTPVPTTASSIPVHKIGSTELKYRMEVAEQQRQALESAKYITKGKRKGHYNPETGYDVPGAANARQNYTEMLNRDMNLLKRDPETFAAQNAGDDSWIDYVAEQNELVEGLFKKNALTDDCTVARHMTGDFSGLAEGEFMADPGFLSTTTDLQAFLSQPSMAFEEAIGAGQEAWTFIIQAPKGTPALPGADYQREIFFGPGTRQKILSVDHETKTVYTEILP